MNRERKIVGSLVSQHAELAAHLWRMRCEAVQAPDHDLRALARLEDRIEAHLDGLLEAGDGALPILEAGLSAGDAGEVFTASLVALQGGKAGRVDLASRLPEHFADTEEANRFAAAWSAVRLGDRTALPLLAGLAVSSPRFGAPALELAVRAMPIEVAGRWVCSLHNEPRLGRHVVQAVGMIGDPVSLPWLLEVMANPDLARLAGHAFSLITGVDLAAAGLTAEPPDGWISGPTDDPDDDDVAMDRDRGLQWPNRVLLQRWWSQHGGRYPRGVRHAAGAPIHRQACIELLRSGCQPQRRAAACELALDEPGTPWFNIAAPAIAPRAALDLG